MVWRQNTELFPSLAAQQLAYPPASRCQAAEILRMHFRKQGSLQPGVCSLIHTTEVLTEFQRTTSCGLNQKLPYFILL